MTTSRSESDFRDEIPPRNAVSIFNEQQDDFPVLKAFQQYIDAEQNKARRRMLSLSIFFGCLMTVMIVFFLITVNNANTRTQDLNDRMIALALKDRDRQAAVVVHPPQDNAVVLSLTAKLDEMQKKLDEAQQQTLALESKAKAEREAAAKALMEQESKTKEAKEIEELKALLAAEKAKNASNLAEEKRRKREEEIEAQRRRLYPEYYARLEQQAAPPVVQTPSAPVPTPVAKAKPGSRPPAVRKPQPPVANPEEDDTDEEIRNLLAELKPELFDDEAADEEEDVEEDDQSEPSSAKDKSGLGNWHVPSR